MTEVLLVASIAAVTLVAMPVLTEYALVRMRSVSAARLLAWQRTVWLPEAISAQDARGVAGAIRKSDAEALRDLKRHVFRDRQQATIGMHAPGVAEFGDTEPATSPRTTVSARTVEIALPRVLNATDVVMDHIRTAQNAVGGTDVTRSLGNFRLMTGGYLRSEVDVVHDVPGFALYPSAHMSEQVTQLTEPWNAGGTNREEAKIQGLVPMKAADLPFMQQIRGATQQVARSISQVFPSFDPKHLEFGLSPGKAEEKTPLDRFEFTAKARNNPTIPLDDRFRYYRAFPPTPVVSTLP